MDSTHLHLAIAHLPIIFPAAGIIVMLAAFFTKSEAVKRAAYLLFIITGISSFVAMHTGGEAAGMVKNLEGVSGSFIGAHARVAKTFALLTYLLTVLSIAGLWVSFKYKTYSTAAAIVSLLLAIVVSYYSKDTGTTGGEIRHTEIRSDQNVISTENDGND